MHTRRKKRGKNINSESSGVGPCEVMLSRSLSDSQENIVPGRAGANAELVRHGACLRPTGLELNE